MFLEYLQENQHTKVSDPEHMSSSIIIQGFNEVSQGRDLEDYMDPENGLLRRFSENDIIAHSEMKDLQVIKPYQLLNGELLNRIRPNVDSICHQFMKALRDDEQGHIAKFIISSGRNTDSDDRLLPRKLREVIDDNMFCLQKLIDTEKNDFVLKLVRDKCITSRHRDRVIRSKVEDKAYELLIILQRRRYIDFVNFMDCLRKTMQNNIAKVLERGGVTEIKVRLLQARDDKRDIAAELVNKLTGYADEEHKNDLNDDQQRIISDLLSELEANEIYFVGTCRSDSRPSLPTKIPLSELEYDDVPTATEAHIECSETTADEVTSNSSQTISLFFQIGVDNSIELTNTLCYFESWKDKLERNFLSLLDIPEKWPPLVKEVTMGRRSRSHIVENYTRNQQNTGVYKLYNRY